MKQLAAGIGIGVAAVLALAIGFGLANAHVQGNAGSSQMAGLGTGTGVHSMMMGGMTGSMMGGAHQDDHMQGMPGMSCMGMDVDEMDKDGDGLCDSCGMSMESCRGMHDSMGSMGHGAMQGMMNSTDSSSHEAMHSAMHGNSTDSGSHEAMHDSMHGNSTAEVSGSMHSMMRGTAGGMAGMSCGMH